MKMLRSPIYKPAFATDIKAEVDKPDTEPDKRIHISASRARVEFHPRNSHLSHLKFACLNNSHERVCRNLIPEERLISGQNKRERRIFLAQGRIPSVLLKL